MSIEGILVDINPNIPEPYLTYIRERNGQIGKDLAQIQGLPFLGYTDQTLPDANPYVVASKTFTAEDKAQFGITSPSNFYGAAVDSLAMVGKTILHPTIDATPPPFYNPNFAQQIRATVLPGFSAFSTEAVRYLYQQNWNGKYDLRIKKPNESDGDGQYPIKNLVELDDFIDTVGIDTDGVVLEPNLNSPRTVSVGFTQIGQEILSFIANQKNEDPSESGISRYLGATVQVVRGNLAQLLSIADLSSDQIEAIKKAMVFNNEYLTQFGVIASRLSYDVLFGYDNYGRQLSGITDITGRVGGTCPALMQSALFLRENPSLQVVQSEVTLNYHPDFSLPSEQQAMVYIDHPSLRLTAKINSYTS